MTGLILAALAPQLADIEPARALARTAEEAEAFASRASRVIGVETLEHKGRKAPGRFKVRVGASADQVPAIVYATRTVVSEYGFGSFQEAPGEVREFRKVVSVNGRQVVPAGKARLALAANMASDDDRARKQLLQDFEKHGLVGATTDMGQALLLFRKNQLASFDLAYDHEKPHDGAIAQVFRYKQKAGDGMRVYDDRELHRPRMQGEIWIRASDGLPLRITFEVETTENKLRVVHKAEVDYRLSEAHAMVLPTEVRYSRHLGKELMVESVARYSGFRMFQVEAGISFTPAEEVVEAPPKP